MLDTFIKIGHTKKTYGSKGQVRIVVEDAYYEDFVQRGFVFIERMGKPLPYFIETIEDMGDLLLKVEDINSPEEAKVIVGKEVFLREKDLTEVVDVDTAINDSLEFGFLVGFELFDVGQKRVGPILEVRELPQQEMGLVDHNGKEVFIPLHADLIEGIDEEGKKVVVRLPEGILEL